jgi:acyl carrier protein
MSGVEQRVRLIIAEVLDVDEVMVRPSTRLVEELHADSLDMGEICVNVGDAFDITIKPKEADAIRTVEQLVRVVEGKLLHVG